VKSPEVTWQGKNCRVYSHTKSLSITPCDQNSVIAMLIGRYTRIIYQENYPNNNTNAGTNKNKNK